MNAGEWLGVTKPIVFLFPGLSGTDREINRLQRGCSASFHFKTIHPPSWSITDYNQINLNGLVSYCIAQIEHIAPSGPILLAGYSFGGHIALAVAIALEASGRQIGCLALLDTLAIDHTEAISISRPIQRLANAIQAGAVSKEVGRIIGAIIIRLRNKRLSRFLSKLPRVGFTQDMEERIRISITHSFNLLILDELLNNIAESNETFDFPTVLFRCVEQAPGETADLGWGRYMTQLRIVPVLGGHVTFTNKRNITFLCGAFCAVVGDVLTKPLSCG